MSEEKWVWPFSERKHAEILNNSNKKNIDCAVTVSILILIYIFVEGSEKKNIQKAKWGEGGGGKKGGEEGGVHANLLPAPITSVSGAW